MKNVNSRANIRNIVLAAAAFGAAGSAQAATTNIPVSATVLPPITVAQPADMRFGSVASGATAGTVVLVIPTTLALAQPTTAAPINTGTRTNTGGVILVGGGTCSATVLCGAGSLQVTGPNSGSFSTVTLPATVTLTSGADTMTVGTLTRRYGANGTAGVLTGAGAFTATGTATLVMAGTLSVGIAQNSGVYTGTMAVTVDY
jgi:hypothetical protein